MHVKIFQKKRLLKKCGLQILLCLFLFLFLKSGTFNQYVQLTRWSRGNASHCDERGPGFDSRL